MHSDFHVHWILKAISLLNVNVKKLITPIAAAATTPPGNWDGWRKWSLQGQNDKSSESPFLGGPSYFLQQDYKCGSICRQFCLLLRIFLTWYMRESLRFLENTLKVKCCVFPTWIIKTLRKITLLESSIKMSVFFNLYIDAFFECLFLNKYTILKAI